MKAFPFKDHIEGQYGQSNGMDLRDYFAAKAMQALIWDIAGFENKEVAKHSYEIADAMMKAREQ